MNKLKYDFGEESYSGADDGTYTESIFYFDGRNAVFLMFFLHD